MITLQIHSREGVKGPWLQNEREFDAAFAAAVDEARAAGRLHLIALDARNGNTVSLVVGGEETVLIFGSRGRKPPYCHSRGTGNALDPVLVCYSLGKHQMEIPRRLVIPMDQGMLAVKEFAATGDRPQSITWEEMVADPD